MSVTGYLIWFIITTLCVVALLAIGMVMATGSWQRRHHDGHTSKKPPTS